MRNVEIWDLLAPALIGGIPFAFMTLTFLAAWLLTDLLGHPSLGNFLMAWVITTFAGVMLVRQLPRVLE